MKCPVDGTELLMSERQGVEIDYCPKCRGVWLDRGELDKIIDKTAPPVVQPEPAPAPAPRAQAEPPREWREPYREPRDREAQRDPRHDRDPYKYGKPYKHKKRKSILSEIFDFD